MNTDLQRSICPLMAYFPIALSEHMDIALTVLDVPFRRLSLIKSLLFPRLLNTSPTYVASDLTSIFVPFTFWMGIGSVFLQLTGRRKHFFSFSGCFFLSEKKQASLWLSQLEELFLTTRDFENPKENCCIIKAEKQKNTKK